MQVLSVGCIHGILELVKIPRKTTKISLLFAFPWSNPRKVEIGWNTMQRNDKHVVCFLGILTNSNSP